MVSTKKKFEVKEYDGPEVELKKLEHDRELIQNFISCREEMSKFLYLTPNALRNGQKILIRPKLKAFQNHIEYIEQKKQNKKAWEEGTPKSVEQEKTEKGIVLITFKLLITCLKRMFYFH